MLFPGIWSHSPKGIGWAAGCCENSGNVRDAGLALLCVAHRAMSGKGALAVSGQMFMFTLPLVLMLQHLGVCKTIPLFLCSPSITAAAVKSLELIMLLSTKCKLLKGGLVPIKLEGLTCNIGFPVTSQVLKSHEMEVVLGIESHRR